jgi:alkaline phosphatase D
LAQQFLESGVPIFGVWDDHDYNMNDGGQENLNRKEVQQIFLDFLDEEENSWRRQRDGLYASYLFGKDDRKVKLILLDVRSHLDRETGDVLGHQQWVWLESEIINDDGAALIVVGSGMQVITEMAVIDKVSNFPWSYQRLLQILAQNPKVLILSGDVHFGEIGCHNISNHAIYEVTSSGLTHKCLISLVPEFVCDLALK